MMSAAVWRVRSAWNYDRHGSPRSSQRPDRGRLNGVWAWNIHVSLNQSSSESQNIVHVTFRCSLLFSPRYINRTNKPSAWISDGCKPGRTCLRQQRSAGQCWRVVHGVGWYSWHSEALEGVCGPNVCGGSCKHGVVLRSRAVIADVRLWELSGAGGLAGGGMQVGVGRVSYRFWNHITRVSTYLIPADNGPVYWFWEESVSLQLPLWALL